MADRFLVGVSLHQILENVLGFVPRFLHASFPSVVRRRPRLDDPEHDDFVVVFGEGFQEPVDGIDRVLVQIGADEKRSAPSCAGVLGRLCTERE